MKTDQSRSQALEEEAEERIAPPGEVVYRAILREGEHELERKSIALAWSGLAAGLSMGFSFVAEGLLRAHLPETVWTAAVTKLGYAVGFLIVILGRQQLFTKNTLTVILPLFNRRAWANLANVGRLWSIVLGMNLVGAFLFAWLLARTRTFPDPMHATFALISSELPISHGFLGMLLRGMLAGWLIALMIWLLPYAEAARVWVITILAYFVGLGHFPHIVAGSVPAFYAVLDGTMKAGMCIAGFLLPTLLGNIIGGVAVVAALAHAEFIDEENKSNVI